MKLKIILLALSAAIGANAQTLIRAGQVAELRQAIAGASTLKLLAVTSAGIQALVPLDVVIDLAAGTIRPIASSLRQEVETQVVTALGQLFQPAFTPASQSKLMVLRNGLLQALGATADYTLVSGAVQFNSSAGLAVGDHVTLSYWR